MLNLYSIYITAIPLLLFAVLVIAVRNPIYSVVSLMLLFCFATVFLILLGCDFIAFIFLMVYVGAIAVLFLFVVMMLNIRNLDWDYYFYRYLPLGGFICIVLFVQFLLYFNMDTAFLVSLDTPNTLQYLDSSFEMSNILHIGIPIYTIYVSTFIYASLILLVAMFGAIVLTLHRRFNLKKQQVVVQVRRANMLKLVSYIHKNE